MTEVIRVGEVEIRFLHDKDGTGGSLDMFEVLVPPGAKVPAPHYHRDWDETVYGLAGTMTWTLGGETVETRPGGTTFIRRGVVHGFVNRHDTPAKVLSVLTPGVLGPAYFREIGALVNAGGPPDPQQIAEVMRCHGLMVAPG